MGISKDHVDAFANLFRGNTSHYGVHVPSAAAPGKKASGKSYTEHQPYTTECISRHLNGEQSIGAIPITEENTCWFCAIDIDVYPVNPKPYIHFMLAYAAPFTLVRSKSGGMHLYIFFRQPEPAKGVQEMLQQLCQVLGLPAQTEIFPKQTQLVGEETGTWINLPYFDAEKTTRAGIGLKMEAVPLPEFVRQAYTKLTSLALVRAWMDALPLAKAPPCLQSLFFKFQQGMIAENRNIYLFNVAVYMKARFPDEEWEEQLLKCNSLMAYPLTEGELLQTVTKSHKRHTYSYKCSEGLLSEYCNKRMCAAREYGKGSVNISNFNFEKLTQVTTSPPYYKWFVNGVEMVFASEDELRNQNIFLNYCIRYLHRLPNRQKENSWAKVLNTALANIQIEQIDKRDDTSTEYMFTSHLQDFFSRPRSKEPNSLLVGMVYQEKERALYFKIESLIEFLEKNKGYNLKDKTLLHHKLTKMNASTCRVTVAPGKQVRCWKIRLKDVPSFVEEALNPDEPASPQLVATGRAEAASRQPEPPVEVEEPYEEIPEYAAPPIEDHNFEFDNPSGDIPSPSEQFQSIEFDVPLIDFNEDTSASKY